MPFIDFTTGQVLTADQMDLVMRQSVMRFADAATRDTALAEVLAEGMVCYLDDTNEVLKYDGTDWVAFEEPVITTQGDLIIGDASGDAVRLPVGAADTVLTSDGTTLSFAAAGGGGGETFVNAEFNKLSALNVDFPINTVVRFAVISSSSQPMTVSLFDSSESLTDTILISTDNPFSYFVGSTAISKITFSNDIENADVTLVFSDPTSASNPTSSSEVLTFNETQSVTLVGSYDAYVFGGGGQGGGGSGNFGGGGGGGGSGFFATGTLTSGTYTATIGAGGESFGNPAAGGSSSIGTITAAGGNPGQLAGDTNNNPVSGGSGGSGGGGTAGDGAANGASGANGDGTGGTGSGTSLPQTDLTLKSIIAPGAAGISPSGAGGFYAGGAGSTVSNRTGVNALRVGGGGGGGCVNNASFRRGGFGGAGVIFLVKVA